MAISGQAFGFYGPELFKLGILPKHPALLAFYFAFKRIAIAMFYSFSALAIRAGYASEFLDKNCLIFNSKLIELTVLSFY